MPTFTFKAQTPRRFPDPTVRNCVRHIFFCAATDIPLGLPKGANPRTQDDIDRGIYRDVKRSLFNVDCTHNSFHLKNKGITIIAEDVQKQGEDTLNVVFSSEEQGIVDGAHTYELLVRNQAGIVSTNAGADVDAVIDQYVKVEILVGLPLELVTEVAGGLNTAVQVQRMSLADLDDKFDWIKNCLSDSNFLDHIAFKQNEIKEFDVRDVLRLLDLFNTTEFPNNGSSYPIRAYTSKESVLKHYLDKGTPYADNYKRLAPILKDILVLHDTISADARDLYNAGGGRRAGRLKFVEGPSKPDKKYRFSFTSEEREYRLSGGALIPMLGAFRAAVITDDQSGMAAWKGGFEEVLDLWEKTGRDLMDATQETSEELGRNPNAIGKSKKHWAFLHNLLDRQIS